MKNTELCVSICKYNPNLFNGRVCVGCFREQHEIRNWHKMTEEERKVVKKDVIIRKMEYKRKK